MLLKEWDVKSSLNQVQIYCSRTDINLLWEYIDDCFHGEHLDTVIQNKLK